MLKTFLTLCNGSVIIRTILLIKENDYFSCVN